MATENSTVFGRKITGKQFHMETPESTKPDYSKALVMFLDHEGKEIGNGRLCTYITGKIQDLVLDLKKVYKEVNVLERKDGVNRVQVTLDAGTTVDESFQKVRAYRK